MSSKKILHVITSLTVGGAEMMLFKLIKASEDSIQHVVVSMVAGGGVQEKLEKIESVKLYTLNMKRGVPNFKSLLNLAKLIKEEKPDVIQSWMYHANIITSIAHLLLFFKKPPLVWNIRHSLHYLNEEPRLTRLLIKVGRFFNPTHVIYNSNTACEQHRNLGYKHESTVIHNGFDIELFDKSNSLKDKIRKKLGIPIDAKVFLHVGRYHRVKGHDIFVDAAIDMIIKKRIDNIIFVMIGRDVDKNNIEIMDKINRSEVGRKIFLLGEQSEMHRYYNLADVYVSSSYSEAFSNSIGEAMACGVPAVATDVGDSKAIIGECGISIDKCTASDLVDAYCKMLSLSVSEMLNLSNKARLRAVNNFGISKIRDKYINLYDSLLKDVV